MTRDERLNIFNSNQGLAVFIANKHWYNSPMTHDDLVQEALLALWSATERYDANLSVFSTYATQYIYHSLTNYAYKAKYGCTGSKSNFREAVSLVKIARREDRRLDDVLKENKASSAIATYANIIYAGDAAFVSLHAPMCVDGEPTTVTLGDIIPADYDIEETSCDHVYAKQIMDLFDKKFTPKCLSYSTADAERRAKLLSYFRESIFGVRLSQVEIANRLGVSESAVSAQFKRWTKQLQKLLRQEVDTSRF